MDKVIKDFDEAYKKVEISGYNLFYLSDKLKADKKIVLRAIKQEAEATSLCDESLRSDREFALVIIDTNPDALEFFSDIFKDDIKIVLHAVKKDGRVLRYASDRLKNNPKTVLAALKECEDAIDSASDDLKSLLGNENPLVNLEKYLKSKKFHDSLIANLEEKIILKKIKL